MIGIKIEKLKDYFKDVNFKHQQATKYHLEIRPPAFKLNNFIIRMFLSSYFIVFFLDLY